MLECYQCHHPLKWEIGPRERLGQKRNKFPGCDSCSDTKYLGYRAITQIGGVALTCRKCLQRHENVSVKFLGRFRFHGLFSNILEIGLPLTPSWSVEISFRYALGLSANATIRSVNSDTTSLHYIDVRYMHAHCASFCLLILRSVKASIPKSSLLDHHINYLYRVQIHAHTKLWFTTWRNPTSSI